MPDQEFLTLKEFAKKSFYSERYVRQKCNDGEIKASKAPGGRKWFIPVDELIRFQTQNMRPSPDKPVEIQNDRPSRQSSETIPERTAQEAIASLVGSWDEGCAGDMSSISQLVNEDYSNWIPGLRHVLTSPESPVKLTNGSGQ